jgi:hypothetical protein
VVDETADSTEARLLKGYAGGARSSLRVHDDPRLAPSGGQQLDPWGGTLPRYASASTGARPRVAPPPVAHGAPTRCAALLGKLAQALRPVDGDPVTYANGLYALMDEAEGLMADLENAPARTYFELALILQMVVAQRIDRPKSWDAPLPESLLSEIEDVRRMDPITDDDVNSLMASFSGADFSPFAPLSEGFGRDGS